jgi:hypothetical protein
MFNAEVVNNTDNLNRETKRYKEIPIVSNVTQQQIMDNYFQIKLDIKRIFEEEVTKLKREKRVHLYQT